MPTSIGTRILPCLLVSDMRRSLEFYIGKLGFTQTGYYPIEADPIRTEVRRDGVAIVLYTESSHDREQPPSFSGAFYIFPENLEQLADELRAKVPFAWGTEETDFGLREFAVHDPDGYTFIFAQRV